MMNLWILSFLTLTTLSSSWNQYGLPGADISVDCSLNKIACQPHMYIQTGPYTNVHTHMHKHTPQHTWRSENNIEVSALLHHVALRDGAQVFILTSCITFLAHTFSLILNDVWSRRGSWGFFMFSFYLLTSFMVMDSPFSSLYNIVNTWSKALRWLKGPITTKQDSLKKLCWQLYPSVFYYISLVKDISPYALQM